MSIVTPKKLGPLSHQTLIPMFQKHPGRMSLSLRKKIFHYSNTLLLETNY